MWSLGSNEIIVGIELENCVRFESVLNSWMFISIGYYGILLDIMKNRSLLVFIDEDIVVVMYYLEVLSELFFFILF